MPTSALSPAATALLDAAHSLHAAGLSMLPLHDKEPYDHYKRPYRDPSSGEWVHYPRLRWKPHAQHQAAQRQVKAVNAGRLAITFGSARIQNNEKRKDIKNHLLTPKIFHTYEDRDDA